MDINKLAVLCNNLDGIENTAEILDVDAELIQQAIEGKPLNNFQNAELETAFNQIYLEPENFDNIDYDALDVFSNRLDIVDNFISDEKLSNYFRESLAENEINLDYLENGYGLFADLTTAQLERIVDNIDDTDTDFNAMFEKYFEDDGLILSRDLEDSEFWAWYRQYFYDN